MHATRMPKCLKNTECVSGYCKRGICAEAPLEGLDPCKPNKCGEDLICDSYTDRCQYKLLLDELEEQKRTNTCSDEYDCPLNSFCNNMKRCEPRPGLGADCAYSDECRDGLDCYDNRCVTKCFKDTDCPYGQTCGGEFRFAGHRLCGLKSIATNVPLVIEKPPTVETPSPGVENRHVSEGQGASYSLYGAIGAGFVMGCYIWVSLLTFLLSIILIITWSLVKRRNKAQNVMEGPTALSAPYDSPSASVSTSPHTTFSEEYGSSPYHHISVTNIGTTRNDDVVRPPLYEEAAGVDRNNINTPKDTSFQKH